MPWLEVLWNTVRAGGLSDKLVDVLDVLLVSYLIYEALLFVRGTRAVSLIKGLVFLLLLLWATSWLPTFNWLLSQLILPGVLAIVIIFQPELRMTLERLGRGGPLRRALTGLGTEEVRRMIREVAAVAEELAERRIGALIAIERDTGLEDVARSGMRLGATVSAELLHSLFIPSSPLHDGGVVVRGDEVVAAGCVLPQSDAPHLRVSTGLRHRAAVGLTERTDAVCVVVSEETGTVSLAVDGVLVRDLDRVRLTERLQNLIVGRQSSERSRLRFGLPWRNGGGGA
ncbi:MAG: TIGR00159 family protein [Armatimonadetes bacterium]|nr:TIGR00159 family protein [Armatimonadota bacterium]